MVVMIVLMFLCGLVVGRCFGSGGHGWRRVLRIGVGAFAISFAGLLVFMILTNKGPRQSETLFFVIVPFLLGALAGKALLFFVSMVGRGSFSETEATNNPAGAQDRQMVLDMLRDGKVSGEQGAELLKALGPTAGPADGLPLTKAVVGAVCRAMLIVIGFMLPWAYVQLPPMFGGGGEGYQAGYNLGFLGWLILVLGTVPALLVCIPALDKHVRLGLLHIVIACIGGAFVISLLVKSPSGIGLWVAGAGFGLQFLTALGRVGFAGALARR